MEKTVLITGGSRGIGAAAARRFAAGGYRVAVNYLHAKERAEEAARKQWREAFDVACARAVAALPVLSEYCLPLVKVGGVFIALKGASGEEELAAAKNAMRSLSES